MTFAHYCICGAKWAGEQPQAHYEKIKAIMWTDYHSGPGHAPTDAATAGRIRRKNDAEEREASHKWLQD
jgi:hypothetical protein